MVWLQVGQHWCDFHSVTPKPLGCCPLSPYSWWFAPNPCYASSRENRSGKCILFILGWLSLASNWPEGDHVTTLTCKKSGETWPLSSAARHSIKILLLKKGEESAHWGRPAFSASSHFSALCWDSSGLLSGQVSVVIQRVHFWRINFYWLILGEELPWGSPSGKLSKG